MNAQLLTNTTGISLSVAAWLAHDDYDHIDDADYISATGLLKSTRQIILGGRLENATRGTADVSGLMHNSIGSAIHNSLENVWTNHYRECMSRLNYPPSVIDRVRINPEVPEQGTIPVYLERRAFRKIGKYTLGGKFDFVGNGILEDFKTTGVFTYISGSSEWKYRLQGSIYRWLNPELITGDYINIQFVFTDWSRKDSFIQAKRGYPPTKILTHKVTLMSLAETELWVTRKLDELDQLRDADERDLPMCTAEFLWQDAPVFKYYKNPSSKNRSTKNFDTYAEATIRWIEDGRIGVIDEVPGETKGCHYCDAFPICSQKDALIACGSLKIKEE